MKNQAASPPLTFLFHPIEMRSHSKPRTTKIVQTRKQTNQIRYPTCGIGKYRFPTFLRRTLSVPWLGSCFDSACVLAVLILLLSPFNHTTPAIFQHRTFSFSHPKHATPGNVLLLTGNYTGNWFLNASLRPLPICPTYHQTTNTRKSGFKSSTFVNFASLNTDGQPWEAWTMLPRCFFSPV